MEKREKKIEDSAGCILRLEKEMLKRKNVSVRDSVLDRNCVGGVRLAT